MKWDYFGIFPIGAEESAPFWGIRGMVSTSGSYAPKGIVVPDTTTPTTPDTVTITCIAIFTAAYEWEELINGRWVSMHETHSEIEVNYPLGSGGEYQYRCKLTGWAGTAYTAPVTITVSEPVPTISITTDVEIINIGQTATLTARVLPRPEFAKAIEWQKRIDETTWEKIGEGDTYIYSPTAAGVVSFRALAIGYGETTASNIIPITTRDPPTVSIEASATEITTLETSTITATVEFTKAIEWQLLVEETWQTISGETQTTYVFGSEYAGEYQIRAKVTGDGGTAVSESVTITVRYPTPVITITADKESIILGESVTFTADAQYAVTVEWLKKDGTEWTVIGEGDSHVFTPEDAGTYYVRADAVGPDEVTESNVITITVRHPVPTISITADLPEIIYVGDTVTITAAAEHADSFEWQKLIEGVWQAIPGETGTTYACLCDAEGTYSIRCVAIGPGGAAISNVITFEVQPTPEPPEP